VNVSIIIPVCPESKTIDRTLAALHDQTFGDWEAIVVDCGAPPELAAVIARSAEQDSRIRVASRPGIGLNDARNSGAGLARFKWLLFCNPEDWLLPEALMRLTQAAAPRFEAVYCKWAYIAPEDELLTEEFWGAAGDMFEVFASRPAFPLHACIVRASIFKAVGGFDARCTTCADWDLWQRIARTGAHFGMVDEALALVAIGPSRDAADLHQLLADGLRLIALGQASDSRVVHLAPPHANGLPCEHAPSARFLYACRVAGLALGRGEDPRALLGALNGEQAPGIDPYDTVLSIFTAALCSAGRGPAGWIQLWPAIERQVGEFLVALEAQSQSTGLARRVASRLERMIFEQMSLPRPLMIGATYGVPVEVTEPIPDLVLPISVERLHCVIAMEGEPLGTLELPVCDGAVPAYVLADAIAAQFAWPILGRYFEHTVYRELVVKRHPGGVSLYQGSECLAAALPDDAARLWRQAHDQIGWTFFLQQIWGSTDPQVRATPPLLYHATDNPLAVELSEPLPNIVAAGTELKIIPMVGGVALGVVPIATHGDVVAVEQLHAAISAATGFELCRAAVREGLLGRPLAETGLLRARLAEVAARGSSRLVPHAAGGAPPTYDAAWTRVVAPSDPDHTLVLARREPTVIGTSASRRARLPVAAAHELIEAAALTGEPVPGASAPLASVLYMPDVIYSNASANRTVAISASEVTGVASDTADVSEPDPVKAPPNFACASQRQTGTRVKQAIAPPLFRAGRATRVLAKTLRRVQKLRSPVYRAQILRRMRSARLALPRLGRQIITFARPVLPAKTRSYMRSRIALHSTMTALSVDTDRLPILMYHRVAPSGLPAMGRFRVTPDAFAAQLRYLRDSGYHSITLEEWSTAQETRRPLTGRAVLLTFDDGYVDFLTYAFPLLKQYGFSAIVFLVADHIGGSNDWDQIYGEKVPLMGWDEIHWLQHQGIVFGSHTVSHRPLTSLSAEATVLEGIRSRVILEHKLRAPISAIAYPYGDLDPSVQHLIGATGYRFGLSCRPGLSMLQTPPLALPRIEVTGDSSLQSFAAKLTE
jgi:peptidoglycan/xylan/chitin deacetylase (PgdA/CDA1 family)